MFQDIEKQPFMDDSLRIDYNAFIGMDEWEVRRTIAGYLRVSERFRSMHQHLDTVSLLTNFDKIAASECKAVLMLASRPFTNLNNLNTAYRGIPIDKIHKVKETFNGPAFLSNLLPPADALVGRFDHPDLQSGKESAWKDVAGKLECVQSDLPVCFFWEEEGYGKKASLRERKRVAEMESYIEKYVMGTLSSFEEPHCYPGGAQALHKRCFSLYCAEFVRDKHKKLRGYKVRWIADYTHKSETTWSEKSKKVTVFCPIYRVYIYDNGVQFAGWFLDSIKDQVSKYEAMVKGNDEEE